MNHTIQINIDPMLRNFQRGLGDVCKSVTMSLAAVQSLQESVDLAAIGNVIRFGPPPEISQESKNDCRKWILTNGLRNAIELVEPLLIEVKLVLGIHGRHTKGGIGVEKPITFEEWEKQQRAAELKGFENEGINAKLEYLEKHFGISVPLGKEIVSIQQARTCLTHRQGVVGHKDLKKDPTSPLVVNFQAIEIVSVGEDSVEEPVTIGGRVDAGRSVGIRMATRTKAFGLGSQVDIPPQEFFDMALTIWNFGCQLHEAVKKQLVPGVSSPPKAALHPAERVVADDNANEIAELK